MNGLTSGSISLDFSGLTRSIVSALEPMFEQMNQTVRQAGATALDYQETMLALAANMPPGIDFSSVAEHLAQSLTLAGYSVVRTTGPGIPAPPQAKPTDTWFEPGRED